MQSLALYLYPAHLYRLSLYPGPLDLLAGEELEPAYGAIAVADLCIVYGIEMGVALS